MASPLVGFGNGAGQVAQRSIRSSDVIETLSGLMIARGVPGYIRSDNGPEFTVRTVR